MTRKEAKKIFLNRGFIDGIYDGNKWREACIVISKWLEQEPKTGHWIKGKYTDDDIRYNDNSYKCDKCGKIVDFKENYCPNCGAKMVEPQESEG